MAIKQFLGRHIKAFGIFFAVIISLLILIFRNDLIKLQGYGLFGLFILSILGNATIVFPTPVILTAFIGGAVFNPALVAIIVSIGAAIGELTGYLAGFGSEEIVQKDKNFQKIKHWMGKHGLWTLFVLAVIPNPFFDLAGIVAGATGISVYKYFIIVWLGKLVKFAAIAYLGSGSINLIDKFL